MSVEHRLRTTVCMSATLLYIRMAGCSPSSTPQWTKPAMTTQTTLTTPTSASEIVFYDLLIVRHEKNKARTKAALSPSKVFTRKPPSCALAEVGGLF
jgi:hypothetical protein